MDVNLWFCLVGFLEWMLVVFLDLEEILYSFDLCIMILVGLSVDFCLLRLGSC